MATEFIFEESFWYSGCDSSYFAELLPAHSGFWFVALLGQGYLATSAMPHPHKNIIQVLVKYGFDFEEASWESVESARFTQNPFLSKLPSHTAIASAQAGKHSLPQKPIILEFGLRPRQKLHAEPKARRKSQVYFILTADLEYLYIGVGVDPHTALRKLQTTHPQPLNLLGQLSDRRKLSQAIHHEFSHLISQGSWFRYTRELQTYITSILAS
ncbi:MAG: hypothetical protein HC770_01950 [Pseudanabaena sp. CRU_2_10]|nr:hypothetical protein [Pseudanabaena sp. CRU_2_10]